MRLVAFLRAVNVGGRIVKMHRLKTSFEGLALGQVTTFIASGNVVFDSRRGAPALERAIEAQLQADLGFAVTTMIRSIEELREVQRYVSAGLRPDPGANLYVGFLKGTPAKGSVAGVAALSNEADRVTIHGRELYWRSAGGFSKSTLSAARLEKLLGTAATLRNVNTIDRIVEKFGYG